MTGPSCPACGAPIVALREYPQFWGELRGCSRFSMGGGVPELDCTARLHVYDARMGEFAGSPLDLEPAVLVALLTTPDAELEATGVIAFTKGESNETWVRLSPEFVARHAC